MLRAAYCLLGEGGKDLSAPYPNLRHISGLQQGQGWALQLSPLRKPPPALWFLTAQCSALRSPQLSEGKGHLPTPHCGGDWHAACQKMLGRYGYGNSSTAFSPLLVAQPQLKCLSNITDAGQKLHPTYIHDTLMRLVSGSWFSEEAIPTSCKLVKKLKPNKNKTTKSTVIRLHKKWTGKTSGEMWHIPWAPQDACSSQRQGCLCLREKGFSSWHWNIFLFQCFKEHFIWVSGGREVDTHLKEEAWNYPQTWETAYPCTEHPVWTNQLPWVFHSCNNLQLSIKKPTMT